MSSCFIVMHESVYTLVPSWWLCKLHVEAYLKKNQESAKGIVIGAPSQTIVTVYLLQQFVNHLKSGKF